MGLGECSFSPPVASKDRLIALVALVEDELEDQPSRVGSLASGFLDPDPFLPSYSAFLSSLPEFLFGPPST